MGRVEQFRLLDQTRTPNVLLNIDTELRLVTPHAYWYVQRGRAIEAELKMVGGKPRHENPIPNASRIGNLVMSSVIGGTNPGTRDLPESFEAQVANVFVHIRHDVEAAGLLSQLFLHCQAQLFELRPVTAQARFFCGQPSAKILQLNFSGRQLATKEQCRSRGRHCHHQQKVQLQIHRALPRW